MSELTQQMIDTIRKGDKLGQCFLDKVAKQLEALNFSTRLGELDAEYLMNIGAALGDRKPEVFERYADAVECLVAENERLRFALQEIIDNGDYTAPEGMKQIAKRALTENGGSGDE